mgnify:CR=1 FL=1
MAISAGRADEGDIADFEELDLETSDSHLSGPEAQAGPLRDRLESAMAEGMAVRLDDIAAAGSTDALMGIIGEVVAAVCTADLVQELMDMARSDTDDEGL